MGDIFRPAHTGAGREESFIFYFFAETEGADDMSVSVLSDLVLTRSADCSLAHCDTDTRRMGTGFFAGHDGYGGDQHWIFSELGGRMTTLRTRVRRRVRFSRL